MPNRFQVTADCVKKVAHTPLENERYKKKQKKMEECSTFGNGRSVRGKVTALFAIEKNTLLATT